MCIRDRYYDACRADTFKGHPEVSPFVVDHLISLEALLDISILSGFSYGIPKAKIFAYEGELLGDWVGRQGRWPNGARIQAIRDFSPIK